MDKIKNQQIKLKMKPIVQKFVIDTKKLLGVCHFIIVVLIVSICKINAQAQDYDKLFEKEHFDKAEKILKRNLTDNPNDVSALFYYSRFYQQKPNPAYNLYNAFLRARESVSAYTSLRDTKTIKELDNDGITLQSLQSNQSDICKNALDNVPIYATIALYEDYLNKFNDSCSFYKIAVYRRDSIAYATVSNSQSESDFQKFIDTYPDSHFTPYAISKMELIGYHFALKKNNISDYEMFLQKYPESKYVQIVEHKRDSIAFHIAKQQNTEDAYAEFIKKYPDAEELNNAKGLMAEAAYRAIETDTNSNIFTAYLEKYPNGMYSEKARQKIIEIAYNSAINDGSPNTIKFFIEKYPNTEQSNFAQKILDSITAKLQTDTTSVQNPNTSAKSELSRILEKTTDIHGVAIYSIFYLDVFKYFTLKGYSTDLQIKVFKETEEYKGYLNKLKTLRNEMLHTVYSHVRERAFSKIAYDVKRRGFTILLRQNMARGFSGYDESIAIPPKSLKIEDERFIVLKGLPTKEVGNELGNFLCAGAGVTGGTVYDEQLFLQIDERNGLEIEKNPDVNVYFLFTPDHHEVFTYRFCNFWRWFTAKNDAIAANKVRIVVANQLSGKVYYDKTF